MLSLLYIKQERFKNHNMHHIFITQDSINDDIVTISSKDDKENFTHLKSSLRLNVGEKVRVSIADENIDFDYMTEAVVVNNDNIELSIIDKIKTNELKTKINLYQGIPKKDIFEDIVDKSVELGVYSITPMDSTNNVSKITDDKAEKKLLRFNKIAKSAAEQSIRGIIPKINDVLSFKEVIDKISNDKYNLLFYEDVKEFSKTEKIFDDLKKDNDNKKVVNVIIGPEGGFTKDEIVYAESKGISILSLGNRILRVETATLTALSYLNYILEGER